MDKIIVETSVKHPFAKKIMEELNGKTSGILGKKYEVVFKDDNG